jgi:exodeoxyribonuclease VII small subunit
VTDSELSYEQARTELASVVERLEAGGTSLEDSLALWERGEELAAICQRWLDGARSRLATARERRASESGGTDRGANGPSGNGGGSGAGSAR